MEAPRDAGLLREAQEIESEPGSAHEALDDLLTRCLELDASDLHLAPGLPPLFRLHGELVRFDDPALVASEVQELADVLLEWSGRAGLESTGSQDGAITAAGSGRFRFNVFQRLGGVSIALRRLEDRFRTLPELGLPDTLYELCGLADGLVVVAGPTGAGKSTTLAALIDRINQSRAVHIVTIEDPIEYVHEPVRSLVNQRQVGADTATFNDAMIASLREDPDVILLGEVRELETIRTVIRAAETGHLVFTTVHASDCVGAIERLISVFPADEQAGMRQQLSLVLRAVVSQRLIRADGRRGAVEGSPSRVVASEVLMSTVAVANLVASGKSAQLYSAIESGGGRGMQSFEQDLARLLVEGWITPETADVHARSPRGVRDRVELIRRREVRR